MLKFLLNWPYLGPCQVAFGGGGPFQVCSNDGPFFMARSNLLPNVFNGENLEKLIFQLLLKPLRYGTYWVC